MEMDRLDACEKELMEIPPKEKVREMVSWLIAEVRRLRKENASRIRFLDEALNSGDGIYRP